MRACHIKFFKLCSIKIPGRFHHYFYFGLTGLLIGITLLPSQAHAVIDWHLEWIRGNDHAQLFVFNPEPREQSFVLETGDRVRLDNINALNLAIEGVILDDLVKTFDLLIGEDVRFKLPPHNRRSKIDVTVYVIDTAALGGTSSLPPPPPGSYPGGIYQPYPGYQPYPSGTYPSSPQGPYPGGTYQPYAGTYSSSPQTQGGVTTRDLVVTPRDSRIPSLIYRKVIDHEYDAEQLIRTGQKLNSLYTDVQDALLYLFQRVATLSAGAQPIWEASFPELIPPSATPLPGAGEGALTVTFSTSNPTVVPREVTLSAGDILESPDRQAPQVVMGEDISFFVDPNTTHFTQFIRVYRTRSAGPSPTQNTIYTNVVNHDRRLERVIRVGNEKGFSEFAIQSYIYHITEGAPLIGEANALAQELERPETRPYQGSTCFGPFLSSNTTYSTGANLVVLAGVLVPFRVLIQHRIKKQ